MEATSLNLYAPSHTFLVLLLHYVFLLPLNNVTSIGVQFPSKVRPVLTFDSATFGDGITSMISWQVRYLSSYAVMMVIWNKKKIRSISTLLKQSQALDAEACHSSLRYVTYIITWYFFEFQKISVLSGNPTCSSPRLSRNERKSRYLRRTYF